MLKGVRCCWLNPGTEQQVETPACLACASSGQNPCGYPLPILRLMTRDRDPKVVSCSATMVGGCPREHGLKKHVPWYIAPDRAYTRAFGSVIHIGLEKLHTPGPEATVEERFGRQFTLPNGRVVYVTAQLDALYYQDDKHVVLNDYKVVSSLAPSKLKYKAQSYVPQLSIQRWVLAASDLEVTSATLTFLSHEGRRVVDLMDDDPDFPKLMSAYETEQYLSERLPALAQSLDGDYAPPLADADQFWRCRYCDVQAECEAHWDRPLPFRGLTHARNTNQDAR